MVAPWIHDHQPKRVKVAAPEDAPAIPVAPIPVVVARDVQLEVSPPITSIVEEEIVEEEIVEESTDLSKLLKAQLIVLAEERGLDTSGCTKARLIELLKV